MTSLVTTYLKLRIEDQDDFASRTTERKEMGKTLDFDRKEELDFVDAVVAAAAVVADGGGGLQVEQLEDVEDPKGYRLRVGVPEVWQLAFVVKVGKRVCH
jgi:hypothetical protein